MPWYEAFEYETEGHYFVRRGKCDIEAMKEFVAFLKACNISESILRLLDGTLVRLRADSVPVDLRSDIERARQGHLAHAGPYPTRPTKEQLQLEGIVTRLQRWLATAQKALDTYMRATADERCKQQRQPGK